MSGPEPAGRIVRGATIAGVLVVAVTEGLGALHLLAPAPLAAAWLVAGLLAFRLRGRWPGPARDGAREAPGARTAVVLWGVVTVFLGLTFVTGLFGAPNAWDGLTYHLPRVERWVEQGHLGFWPTSVDRQLWMAPFGGYATLQFRLLTGGDRLAFLPSWLAYLGLIVLGARVARQLGGNGTQVALAALVMATTPVAVLHASSVQTDLLAAFWVLAAASLVLAAWMGAEGAREWRHAGWLAAVVALAVLTKATAALALVPWLLLYAWALVRHGGAQAVLRPLLIGLLAVLLVNGPHFARNFAVFGDPLGDPVARQFLRLVPWSPGGGVANLIANLSLHLGSQWAAWNAWWTEGLLRFFERLLGADPVMLFPYFGGFRVQAYSTHESLAGNPVHLVLGLFAVMASIWGIRARRTSPLVPWLVAGVAAVVLHGLLIRWQPYGARLQLVSLVWLAPAVGLLVKRQIVQVAIVTALVVVAVPALTGNYLRPLVGERSVFVVPRGEQYVAERPELTGVRGRIAGDLNRANCRMIGLLTSYDTPEYLFWSLDVRTSDRPSLVHLLPTSSSVVIPLKQATAQVCGLIRTREGNGAPLHHGVHGLSLAWVENGVALYLRQ